MGFPTNEPIIGPRYECNRAALLSGHIAAGSRPPPPPHSNPTGRQRQFHLPDARLHERDSSRASSRPSLLLSARRAVLPTPASGGAPRLPRLCAAATPLPVCHRCVLAPGGAAARAGSRQAASGRFDVSGPLASACSPTSAPSTSPPSYHSVIMSRALARRPVPPFLRQRSTVCDDGYWLGRLDHKDWLAPNEVLKIFANIGDPSLITSVFNKTCNRRDYKPSEALYSLMVDKLACARRFSDVEELLTRARTEKFRFSDEFFFRLIKMYGNVAEHPQKAIDTLLAMPGYNCWPSTKTFNYVLHMLVCKRQYEVVHEIYSSAPRLGVTLDTCSFNILVKGLCQFGKIDEAMCLLHEMPKQACQPNVTTYSTLMHFLCQRCQVDKAFELFEKMQKQDIAADTVVYNILISGLCREERVTEAFVLFKSMTSEGCYPNSGTYQVLLDGLINSGKFVEAKNLVSIMSTEGVRPSFQSYKLLIDGLCSDDCLDDAHLVLKQMVGQGFVPRMGTWKKLLTSMC